MIKKLVLIIGILMAFVSCKTDAQVEGVEKVTVEEFDKNYNPEKDQLIDVRTEEEYKEGFLKDAMLIDVKKEDEFKNLIQDLDKEKTVYLYCRSGKRSLKAAKILKENGFKDIRDIQGGIKAWKGELNHVQD